MKWNIYCSCNHRPNFIFMNNNAPAHQGRIIRERLLKTGVPQMEWPAFSPDLNPIKNLWDQLNRCVEARNSVPQNLKDLRAALQEEWDAKPQQTISRLVNSMRYTHTHTHTLYIYIYIYIYI
ncbi:hypothetical protein MHYP_G00255550 [Metynnis hypsauchen]